MIETYEREVQVGLNAVQLAARVCRAVQSQITDEVLQKQDRSPVTIADYASQAVVCRELAAEFPNDPVVGEEDATALRSAEQQPFLDRVVNELCAVDVAAEADDVLGWIDHGGHDGNCERFWTLDPIDGTKGFLRGEQYAISLALIVEGEIRVAVLCCPNLPSGSGGTSGCTFSAVRGQGAVVRPLHQQTTSAVRVSTTAESRSARFCESVESGHSSHDEAARAAEILQISAEPVRLDSQAKYAVVARGEADIYLRLPTRADYREKIWDHAGGVLVVQEAGGRVTDVDGHDLDFTQGRALERNRGVVVTNGLLHDRVIAALREVGVAS
jgi:HAL2 family 3'(2'),5'-bisphosphate nucleotidase